MTSGVTIYAVAARAGVSISTVSRVLRGSVPVSDDARDRVLEAVRALRYVPSAAASNLAAKRQPALGMVLPHLGGEYYSELLIGFELAAGELGYSVSLTLANRNSDADAVVRSLAERVEGIAFLGRSAASDELVAELAGPRAVVTVARARITGVDAYFATNRACAAELTAHLVDTGRRRIQFVGSPEWGSDLQWRRTGHVEALTERGIEPLPAIDCALDESSGDQVARQLLETGMTCDALMCGSDLLAISIVRRLRAVGVRVPEDVAVTGWDDILTARYLEPSLTTVSQPVRDLGRAAVRGLWSQLTTTTPEPGITVLDSHVVYRQSCCTDAGDDPRHHIT